jgi:phage terminase small subunit
MRAAWIDIQLCGINFFTEKGPRANPSIATWMKAKDTLVQMADRLGLNPGSRVKLQVPKRDDDNPLASSKFAGLLGAAPTASLPS